MALDRSTMILVVVFSALAGFLLFGCDPVTRTEVIVEVDTDLDVPDELNALTIEVVDPIYGTKEETDDIPSVDHLPATLGLVHYEGDLGPFVVTAIGRRGNMARVERTASFYFVPERTLVLPLRLLYDCLYQTCEQGETCTENGCASIDIDSSQLDPWSGD